MNQISRRIPLVLFLILLVPMLVACGSDGDSSPTSTAVPSAEIGIASPAASPAAESTPAPEATAVPSDTPRSLTPEELVEYQPNELGGIPIFMYHNIVSDPELEGHLYRTQDEFYNDLLWLYDRNFYLVGMNDIVRGTFDVPAGKHPVVITFDDSSSMHFSFEVGPDGKPLVDENGEYIVSPGTAVGIIEKFADEHPDFGRTAHFAIIPSFKFSWPDFEQDDLFDLKVQWLVEHGYEVGNHTSEHQDLAGVDVETFARIIAEPYIQLSGVVDPNDPNFAMNVLTLPYGAFEEGGWSGDKQQYLTGGYVWDGYPINIEGVLLVCCGSSPSPFNADFQKFWIPRIRGDDPDFADLGIQIDNGTLRLYTSDGNPDTVTVPWPLPKDQWGKLNEEAIAWRGLSVVKYYPETGKIFTAMSQPQLPAYTYRDRERVAARIR